MTTNSTIQSAHASEIKVSDACTSISKIEIKGLWGTHDFVWDLNDSANILIGSNGSGKSTIINLVNSIINEGPTPKEDLMKYTYQFDEIIISFNTAKTLLFKKVANNKAEISEKYNPNEIIGTSQQIQKQAEKYLKNKDLKHIRVEITPTGAGFYASNVDIKKPFSTQIKTVLVSTFDNFLLTPRAANRIESVDAVRTDLDLTLRELMIDFKSYQLTVKHRVAEAILPLDAKIAAISQKTTADMEELKGLQEILREKESIKKELHKLEDRLFEVLNEMFSNSEVPELSKTIGTDGDNDFVFEKINKQIIQLHQLSSGEKQLLIILMNAVLLDEKPSILLLDEPEISLHISWQEELLDKIRYLAPNAQIILVTHGTRMFVKHNWFQKTVKIQSLTHQIPLKK